MRAIPFAAQSGLGELQLRAAFLIDRRQFVEGPIDGLRLAPQRAIKARLTVFLTHRQELVLTQMVEQLLERSLVFVAHRFERTELDVGVDRADEEVQQDRDRQRKREADDRQFVADRDSLNDVSKHGWTLLF